MTINYHCNVFKLNFLFVLFLFGCEFNTEKIPNISLKENDNTIVSLSEIPKNNEKVHQSQNTNTHITQTPNLSHDDSSISINNIQHLKKDETKEKNGQKETLKQEENSNSDNTPKLNPQSGSPVITKQLEFLAESELNKSLSEKNLISTTSNRKIESTPKPKSQQQSSKPGPELKKISTNNQESFKAYKIQDTSYAKANDYMIYEV